jgi:hypothetical protein
VLAQKDQYPHIPRLAQLFRLHHILALPVTEKQMEEVLREYV